MIIEFATDWRYSPNGFTVDEYKAGSLVEMGDKSGALAVSDGVGKEVDAAYLKKVLAAQDKARKTAEKADADAVAAEASSTAARAAVDEARAAVAALVVVRVTAEDVAAE
jgi:hypothetical protein